jgi:predicted AAA+ superfamily ATPase
VQITLTGSSSKLMSQEIATQLRGRTFTFEIFPFSFNEYLLYKNISSEKLSSKNKSFIINAFNSYLFSGGYPEILDVAEPLRVKILQDYFNLLLYKDLVERHDIRTYSLIKYLVRNLLANNANPITVNKMFGDLKSQGFQVSKDTLHNYLSYLEDALCLSLAPIFTESIRKQQINYRKIYFIDHGLVTSLVHLRSYNTGRLLETMVYNHLRRHYSRDQLFYYKTATYREVDFLVHDRGKVISLVQVCESLEELKTKEREVHTLLQAMDELEILKAAIITRHEFDEIAIENKSIEVVPFWSWALTEEKV